MIILFVLGMLSVVPALVLSMAVTTADPTEGPLGRSFALFSFVYAPIEEFSKFLVFFILVTRLRSLREPADGIFQAAAVGLGFAIVENVLYAMSSGPRGALVRAGIAPLRHMIYSSIWGLVYAVQHFGRRRLTAGAVGLVILALVPASLVHGFSNFMVRLGDAPEMLFSTAITLASFLVLGRLKRSSPYAVRDLGRPHEALAAIGSALVHDPDNPHLHLRAAHFRLRSGDPRQAVVHLEKLLSTRPDDPYATGLLGASLVLAGSRTPGEQALERGCALMSAQTRRIFHRNLWRLLAPGRGPAAAQPRFHESLLHTLLLLTRLREKGGEAAAP